MTSPEGKFVRIPTNTRPNVMSTNSENDDSNWSAYKNNNNKGYINILKKKQDRDLRKEQLGVLIDHMRNQVPGSGHSRSDHSQNVELLQSPQVISLLQDLVRNEMQKTPGKPPKEDPEELYNMPFAVCHRKKSYSTEQDADSTEQDENDSETYPEMYPEDAYSFLALNGPTTNFNWPFQKFKFFLFGLAPFLFQIMLLGLLVSNLRLKKDTTEGEPTVNDIMTRRISLNNDTAAEGDETKEEGIPVDVMMARIVSLVAYLFFPSSTQRDLIKAIQLYPWCDPQNGDIPVGCIRLSSILRFTQSNLAITVVFLLIMKSNDTLEIILNFTAINFISNLDDDAFYIARSGILGTKFREEAKRIGNTKLPACMHRKSKRIWCSAMLATYAAIFLSLMIVMMTTKLKLRCDLVNRGMVNFQCGVSSLLLLYSVVVSLYGACRSRRERRQSPQGLSRQDSQTTIRTSITTTRRASLDHLNPEDSEQL